MYSFDAKLNFQHNTPVTWSFRNHFQSADLLLKKYAIIIIINVENSFAAYIHIVKIDIFIY